jgi:PqqD family protein of HPr-rel-A system
MARPRFVADPANQVRSVDLEGLGAFYHRPSGMTHILAPPAPQILEAIAGSPADSAEILKRIGERFDLAAGEDAEGAIEARLAELEAAGLVHRL